MKLWGGRFEKELSDEVLKFSSSFNIDRRLWKVDITASVAHARMLGEQKILPAADTAKIIEALSGIMQELESGKLEPNAQSEDIHSAIEVLLNQKIGALSGKLHTARSRNDQVATDTRIYLRDETIALVAELKALNGTLLSLADQHTETVLPGMTHLQHAQPVSLAHHLLAYFWMFERDCERLKDSLKRLNRSPLGAAALAGTGFPLNRQTTAKELGFDSVIPNSMDAVSDRDFVIEFLSCASTAMMHLSRMAEEFIIWSTPEFAFIEMSDEVTTGSSIMPQKKNPDVCELIRGRVGLVYGALMGALTMMKGLPLAYNRDMQEDKVFLFQGLDTVLPAVRMMNLSVATATWKTANMKASLAGDTSNATDLADDLVRKGLPFREAHEVIGKIVRMCIDSEKAMEELSLLELQTFSPLFDDESLKVLPHVTVMNARTSEGGTSAEAVRAQISLAKAQL